MVLFTLLLLYYCYCCHSMLFSIIPAQIFRKFVYECIQALALNKPQDLIRHKTPTNLSYDFLF